MFNATFPNVPAGTAIYAPTVLGDNATMRTWTVEQLEDRDGWGDELCYSATTDCFYTDRGEQHKNPCPGDTMAGARMVADELDRLAS